jgi:hypothetical protein
MQAQFPALVNAAFPMHGFPHRSRCPSLMSMPILPCSRTTNPHRITAACRACASDYWLGSWVGMTASVSDARDGGVSGRLVSRSWVWASVTCPFMQTLSYPSYRSTHALYKMLSIACIAFKCFRLHTLSYMALLNASTTHRFTYTCW